MLNIALCDFNHTTAGIHTETMPLAIGLLGSHIMHKHPEQLDVRHFKFIDDFLQEIDSWRPDLMGVSLYSWNSNLGLHMAQLARHRYPKLFLVAGGPNIPVGEKETVGFFRKFPFINLLITKDGEIPLATIVSKLLMGTSHDELCNARLPGTITVEAGSHNVLYGEMGQKIRNLDEVPSPYLTGLMNKFFAYKHHTLAPFIETNRGCPFACTFCHTALKYYNKLQWASHERLEQELDMFGYHFRDRHDVRLFLADNNFGSFKQDYEFAKIVRATQEKYNWPRYIDVTTGKMKVDNIIKVAKTLKWGLVATPSLQTLTDPVLKKISRQNLTYKDYLHLQKKSMEYGKISSTELIMCLPEETKESFLDTIRQVIGSGVEQVIIYTLMNLSGTPLYEQYKANPEGHIFRYRIVPRQFSKHNDSYIFDTEEVIVQTPTFSFEDYLDCRGFAYIIQAVYNDSNFPELIRFLKENNVPAYDWLLDIFERLSNLNTHPAQQLSSFLLETERELWASEEELHHYYSQEKKFQKLLTGDLGGNLLAKYTYLARFNGFQSWLDIILLSAENLLKASHNNVSDTEISTIIRDFRTYYMYTRDLRKLFREKTVAALRQEKSFSLTYDIPSWSTKQGQGSLLAYRQKHRLYSVRYTEEQLTNIQTIASKEPNERSVKIQYIIRGHSRDFWAVTSRAV